jgi:hypothetical protein
MSPQIIPQQIGVKALYCLTDTVHLQQWWNRWWSQHQAEAVLVVQPIVTTLSMAAAKSFFMACGSFCEGRGERPQQSS